MSDADVPTGPAIDDSAPTQTASPVRTAGTATLASGEILSGRYRVDALLGRGGMGEVYAAHDLELEEDVALKLLRAELSGDPGYRKRLRSEVRLARRVTHPNVCRVHDLGQHADQVFVTMARVPGHSLRQVQRAIRAGEQAPLVLATIVDLISQLCAALGAAHAAGVLHRDVKPDNILVDDGRVVLTDFGVASGPGDGDGSVVGTPAYTAPELLRGERVDGRADVYSATVVAYELLAGTTPFVVHSMRQATRRALDREPPPPLPAGVASGPRQVALDRVLRTGLASDPGARLATPAALAEGLAGALREPADELAPGVGLAPGPLPDAATVGGARRRIEARVATVLTFIVDDATAAPADAAARAADATPDHATSDELERAIVDLGGWPIAVGAGMVSALFGVPTSLGDDAMRAVRAAQRLLARARGGHAGVDTRRVMVRPDGGAHALVAVPRDVARVADALALAAPVGEVWLSAAAARQVAAHVDVAPAGDAGGGRALRVTGEARAASGQRGGLARAREIARLEAVARGCFEARTPRVVEVVGGPGLGKSRLRDGFIARVAERRDVEWLVACAAPLGEAAALSLVRAASADWFDAVAREGEGGRAATLAAAGRWLEERARRRPVAVLFDDLQWADEMSRALVADLAVNLPAVPVLLVVFSREPVGLHGAEVLELGPLDDATATGLARDIAAAADDGALADVVARAGGNPFFVEELARDLLERGDQPGTLPPTVEAVVQARLARLSPTAASLLGAAAVVGRGFWRQAARAAMPAPIDDAELDAALAELERRALAYPTPPSGLDDDRYELANALVRDVAYQRLAPRDRRTAHAAVARWLGAQLDGGVTPLPSTVAARAGTDPELLWALAHHRELGDDPGAAQAWRAAGLRALELFAYHQAHAALRRAWDLSAGTGDAELAERLGEAAFEADTLDAADDAYAAAVARTSSTDDVAQVRLAYRRGQVASARADHAAAIAHYQRGLALVAPGGELTPEARADPRQAALLFGSLGWVRSYQLGADGPAALALCERAVELLDGTPHRRELAYALSRLGGAYMRAGRWADQRSCNERTLALALELGDLSAQATAHVNLGVVLANLGELTAAVEHTERAVALCQRTGARPTIGLALSNLGGYLLELGDLDRASARLAEGIRLLDSVGQRRVLPESYQHEARIAARRGDLDLARAAIARSIALARASDTTADVAVGLRITAQLEARVGAADEAAAHLAEATRLAADADPFEHARLAAAAARLHDRAGRVEAAAAARAEARAVFTRLGAVVDLAALDDPDDIR
ncbi:MAG: protein kinase [Myxococcales bacterium]|nr:protein kinase [Myxococcales bacterium]